MHMVNYLFSWILAFSFLFHNTRASFETDVLDEHNKYRAKHGCPNLKLDAILSEECKTYAMELAAADTLKHSSGAYGENLCYRTSDPVACVKNWYDEIKDYNYDKPAFSYATGHFTQVIWKSSNILGVGKHANPNGKIYVVARYKPPGNVEGMFQQNVPRGSGNKQEYSKYLSIFSWIILWLLTKSGWSCSCA